MIWNSCQKTASDMRLLTAFQADGKLHSSPELVIEVLSPGSTNERRDREVKRKLYSRRGAKEYWIVNRQERRLEVYRRQEGVLELDRTLDETDTLQSPSQALAVKSASSFVNDTLAMPTKSLLGRYVPSGFFVVSSASALLWPNMTHRL
jgi:hypothetical protein